MSHIANHAVRLGVQAWDELAEYPKIEQVDVTQVDTSTVGHLYYGDESAILADLRSVLTGVPAAERKELVHVQRHYAYRSEVPAVKVSGVDWDLRRGWDWQHFSHGWDVLLDRKVIVLLGLALLVISCQQLRIRWRKRP